MARISAQVILKTADNIPANFVTNTLYFDVDEDNQAPGGSLEDQSTTIGNALRDDFYDALGNGGLLAGLMATGHRIKFVDIDGPQPQYPYLEYMFDISGSISPSQLPSECCVVTSFEAQQQAGINQATRRGRLFLGPVARTAIDDDGRLLDTIRGNVSAATDAFAANQDTAGFSGWKWMIYSRKNDAMAQVVMGHVDNAIDTQRRRGVQSTARTVWASS